MMYFFSLFVPAPSPSLSVLHVLRVCVREGEGDLALISLFTGYCSYCLLLLYVHLHDTFCLLVSVANDCSFMVNVKFSAFLTYIVVIFVISCL